VRVCFQDASASLHSIRLTRGAFESAGGNSLTGGDRMLILITFSAQVVQSWPMPKIVALQGSATRWLQQARSLLA
jgi:hypothetical protein